MASRFKTLFLMSLISQPIQVLAVYHPCAQAASVAETLRSCPTANAYCSSVVGVPITHTRIKHHHTHVSAPTVTSTSTSTSSVTSYTGTQTTTTTSVVTSLTSTLIYSTSCPSNDPHRKRSASPKEHVPDNSCGVGKREPSKITAACDCLFGSTITRTKTKTIGFPKHTVVTTTLTTTISTDSTTTVTTTSTSLVPTETACTEHFHIQATNGRYSTGSFLLSGSQNDYPTYDGYITIFAPNNTPAVSDPSFYVIETYYLETSTGYIKTTNGNELYLEANTANEYYVVQGGVDQSPSSDPPVKLNCAIDDKTSSISCEPEDTSIPNLSFVCWNACDQQGCMCTFFASESTYGFLDPVNVIAYPAAS